MSIAWIVRWFVTIAIVLFVLDKFGMSPAKLWHTGKSQLENFSKDTQQLTSGEAIDKVSQKMKSEMQAAQPVDAAGDKEMARELHAERSRLMEAKFNAVQNPLLIPSDPGKLSEQVVRNAQNAAGGN